MDALCNVLADPFAIEEVAEHTEMIELVVHIMQSNDWDEQVRHSDMPGARFVLAHGRVEARLMWRPFAMLITAPGCCVLAAMQLVERAIAMIMPLAHSAASIKIIVESNGLQVQIPPHEWYPPSLCCLWDGWWWVS